MQTQVPLKQADYIGQARKQTAEASNAEQKAVQQMLRTKSEILYANDAGTASFKLGIPEVAQMTNQHVAENKLMSYGINPQIAYTSNRLPISLIIYYNRSSK